MATWKKMTFILFIATSLIFIGTLGIALSADNYPVRPVKVICQWGAGSNVDLALRMLAEPMKKELGQPWIVEVKPGGQGQIGQNAMAKAKPDGYTIGLAALGPMVTAHLYKPSPPYKMEDFQGIAGFYLNPGGIGVHRNAPWNTLDDFLADARANPGKYKVGLHVARGPVGMALRKFIVDSGIKVTLVPFAGGKKSMQAVMSGDVDAAALHVGFALRFPDKLKMLELFERKRSMRLPDLPTSFEKGRTYIMGARTGFVAPAGTPIDRVVVLETALKKTINDPTFGKNLMNKLGMEPAFADHEAIWAEWQETYARFSGIVKELAEAEKAAKK